MLGQSGKPAQRTRNNKKYVGEKNNYKNDIKALDR